MDMAGKVTLALKAMSVGISEDFLFLDPAQAGGLMGKSDGAIINVRGSKELTSLGLRGSWILVTGLMSTSTVSAIFGWLM